MQQFKEFFKQQTLQKAATLQSCIRTDDIDLVGDGSHLTFFEMIGNFSFGNNDYNDSVLMWDLILKDLNVPVTHITCHPEEKSHQELWTSLGYKVILDSNCIWSDGDIGGYCCEVFYNDLELGNLVNPLGNSVDVGFGLERLVQVLEGKEFVDQTSLFDTSLSNIGRDHFRSISIMLENQVLPGAKGRASICRKLLRKFIVSDPDNLSFQNLKEKETQLLQDKVNKIEKFIDSIESKPLSWWKETHGITQEDLDSYKEKIKCIELF